MKEGSLIVIDVAHHKEILVIGLPPAVVELGVSPADVGKRRRMILGEVSFAVVDNEEKAAGHDEVVAVMRLDETLEIETFNTQALGHRTGRRGRCHHRRDRDGTGRPDCGKGVRCDQAVAG